MYVYVVVLVAVCFNLLCVCVCGDFYTYNNNRAESSKRASIISFRFQSGSEHIFLNESGVRQRERERERERETMCKQILKVLKWTLLSLVALTILLSNDFGRDLYLTATYVFFFWISHSHLY